ncbi:hypothetical protein ASPZODRAFT_68844 [Penicilliopsis zonata CBS 506.65]|uniref:FAD/NAD(P)-binding domain-containing protein n=1 Tax=Penicilliopsis zonata CBS 506.65 TaxID=1073090 RepID=A0A1L9SFH8_9EURO|nr:hypothetical protein ASPZODRAFT_68844 [Penicilliopsis zonata CBS 506.65]OJJ45951.1 hypothetical protein ASPZODRAFT_68844 [Penicilliopsis zonata CBS 506.65]
MTRLLDCVIVGGGPAGLSVALGLCRVRRTAVILDSAEYRNAHSPEMHNVLTWDHQNPAAYRAAALRQIVDGRYDTVQYAQTRVESVVQDGEGVFVATDSTGTTWLGRTLVIATGITDVMPGIPGFRECWKNMNIYHCPFCHGYENSGAESAAIIAVDNMASPMGAHFAKLFSRFANKIAVYTHGNEAIEPTFAAVVAANPAIQLDHRRLARLIPSAEPGGKPSVQLETGEVVTHDFFSHQPTASPNIAFAKGLNLALADSQTELKTDQPFFQTNVPGCFALGDIASPFRTVTAAVSAGSAVAGGIANRL